MPLRVGEPLHEGGRLQGRELVEALLEGLLEGEVRNQITVSAREKRWTRVALDRMLSIH